MDQSEITHQILIQVSAIRRVLHGKEEPKYLALDEAIANTRNLISQWYAAQASPDPEMKACDYAALQNAAQDLFHLDRFKEKMQLQLKDLKQVFHPRDLFGFRISDSDPTRTTDAVRRRCAFFFRTKLVSVFRPWTPGNIDYNAKRFNLHLTHADIVYETNWG